MCIRYYPRYQIKCPKSVICHNFANDASRRLKTIIIESDRYLKPEIIETTYLEKNRTITKAVAMLLGCLRADQKPGKPTLHAEKRNAQLNSFTLQTAEVIKAHTLNTQNKGTQRGLLRHNKQPHTFYTFPYFGPLSSHLSCPLLENLLTDRCCSCRGPSIQRLATG